MYAQAHTYMYRHTHFLSPNFPNSNRRNFIIPPRTVTVKKTDSPIALLIILNSHQDYLCPANFKKQFSPWELKYNGPLFTNMIKSK